MAIILIVFFVLVFLIFKILHHHATKALHNGHYSHCLLRARLPHLQDSASPRYESASPWPLFSLSSSCSSSSSSRFCITTLRKRFTMAIILIVFFVLVFLIFKILHH